MNVSLRYCFARVQADPIHWIHGTQSENQALEAVNMIPGGSRHYLQASKMYAYLWRNPDRHHCNHVVTIYVPGLRAFFTQHQHLLDQETRNNLDIANQSPIPNFFDIYNFQQLWAYQDQKNVSEYQLNGDITPFDVVHMPVWLFVNSINTNTNLIFRLFNGKTLIIRFVLNDFWDNEYQTTIPMPGEEYFIRRCRTPMPL